MPRFNERRGDRRDQDSAYYGDRDQPRRRHEDGPWSPYNGGPRSFERSQSHADRRSGEDRRFDPRGRDYWRENQDESPRGWYENQGESPRDWRERDELARVRRGKPWDPGASERWDARSDEPWTTRSDEPWDARSDERWRGRVAERETRRDPWRYREHLHDPITEGEPSWGNEMGLRSDQPSGRSIPRGPDWQSEPRSAETWIAREDRYRDDRRLRSERHGERRYRDEPHGPGREQTGRDTRSREAGGEQYPSQGHGSWIDDQYRGGRSEREVRGPVRDMHEHDRGPRDYARELRERDQRDYDRGQRDVGREQRDVGRDMRGREQRDYDRGQRDVGRDMRGREQRDDGRAVRDPHQRFYRERRDLRGREQRDVGRDMRDDRGQRDVGRDMRGREQRDDGRAVRDPHQRFYRERRDPLHREQRDVGRDMRDDRGGRGDERTAGQRAYARDMRDREQREMRDREQREMRDREQMRDRERRDMRGSEQRDARDRERMLDRDRRDMHDRELRDMRDRELRDMRHFTDEPGRDIGALHTEQGWMSRREYGVEGRDFRAEQSHELRRDRGEPWHGSETRGTDEYGRGLEQRTPEDRFRPDNREWAMRISGRGDRGGRH